MIVVLIKVAFGLVYIPAALWFALQVGLFLGDVVPQI